MSPSSSSRPSEEFVYRPLSVAAPFRSARRRRFPAGRLVEAAAALPWPGTPAGVDTDAQGGQTSEENQDLATTRSSSLWEHGRSRRSWSVDLPRPSGRGELERILEQARSGWVKTDRVRDAGASRVAYSALRARPAHPGIHPQRSRSEEVASRSSLRSAAPLELFGSAASEAIRELLEIRSIGITLNTIPTRVEDGWLAHVIRRSRPRRPGGRPAEARRDADRRGPAERQRLCQRRRARASSRVSTTSGRPAT